MTKKIWIRCFVVSIILAFLASLLSMTVGTAMMVAEVGEEVPDLRAIDPEMMEKVGSEEFAKHFVNLPTRKLVGLERFTYPLTHPQVWQFYLQAVVTWFIGLFCATTLVSYLHVRGQ